MERLTEICVRHVAGHVRELLGSWRFVKKKIKSKLWIRSERVLKEKILCNDSWVEVTGIVIFSCTTNPLFQTKHPALMLLCTVQMK